jgi:hypothetical protein
MKLSNRATRIIVRAMWKKQVAMYRECIMQSNYNLANVHDIASKALFRLEMNLIEEYAATRYIR